MIPDHAAQMVVQGTDPTVRVKLFIAFVLIQRKIILPSTCFSYDEAIRCFSESAVEIPFNPPCVKGGQKGFSPLPKGSKTGFYRNFRLDWVYIKLKNDNRYLSNLSIKSPAALFEVPIMLRHYASVIIFLTKRCDICHHNHDKCHIAQRWQNAINRH